MAKKEKRDIHDCTDCINAAELYLRKGKEKDPVLAICKVNNSVEVAQAPRVCETYIKGQKKQVKNI